MREVQGLRMSGPRQSTAIPREDWEEDDGPALWWRFPVCEPPYVGDPREDDFPEDVTHWTRIVIPRAPK